MKTTKLSNLTLSVIVVLMTSLTISAQRLNHEEQDFINALNGKWVPDANSKNKWGKNNWDLEITSHTDYITITFPSEINLKDEDFNIVKMDSVKSFYNCETYGFIVWYKQKIHEDYNGSIWNYGRDVILMIQLQPAVYDNRLYIDRLFTTPSGEWLGPNTFQTEYNKL